MKVLIAPLDWGLGHSTRCIPIIKYLNSISCDVIIAADGIQLYLLQKEFPRLQFVKSTGYGITFSTTATKTFIKILCQIPKILISINRESSWLKDFLLKNDIDFIISDNRYGLFSRNVPAVFITHQLTIKTSFGRVLENTLRKINYCYISKFTECWIPDFAGENNMGGKLSHPDSMPSIPVKYLGRLSRIVEAAPSAKEIKLLIILSGPEPQRSIFEQILLIQLNDYNEATVLVRGLPGEEKPLVNSRENLLIYNHLTAEDLNQFINAAKIIISRSGYSTVMDLIGLNKKCIFVPTPGQPEQEYLANYLSSKKICLSYKQNNINLGKAIREADSFDFTNFKTVRDDQYKKVITDFIKGLAVNNKTVQ